MNETAEFALRAVLIGVGATMVMDLWARAEVREEGSEGRRNGYGGTRPIGRPNWNRRGSPRPGAVVLRQLGVPSLKLAYLGRWIGHLPRRHWRHASIARATPIRGESWIGWCAHYSIGIIFSALLLWTHGLGWARSPTFCAPRAVHGNRHRRRAMVHPATRDGSGIASWKTPTPVFNGLKSLVTHTVFGFGMYLAALATASLVPLGR